MAGAPKIVLNGTDEVAMRRRAKDELAARVEEFYNQCHDKDGHFCQGKDGPGRARDNKKPVSGKLFGHSRDTRSVDQRYTDSLDQAQTPQAVWDISKQQQKNSGGVAPGSKVDRLLTHHGDEGYRLQQERLNREAEQQHQASEDYKQQQIQIEVERRLAAEAKESQIQAELQRQRDEVAKREKTKADTIAQREADYKYYNELLHGPPATVETTPVSEARKRAESPFPWQQATTGSYKTAGHAKYKKAIAAKKNSRRSK